MSRGLAGETASGATAPSVGRRVLAWGVHLYTALGLVLAAAILVLLVRGDAEAFRWSFVLMVVATLIDATDGTMARGIRIKEVLPGFDGRKLDDLTDFLTYTFLPLMLIWRAGLVPGGTEAWLLLPLLASAYGFCQVEAKTEDGYFLGFPSLWNVVAFYLYALDLPGTLALGIIAVLALLTFVPSRYLYPSSRAGRLNAVSNVLGVIWTAALAWLLWAWPADRRAAGAGRWRGMAALTLFYPVFYLAASWWVTARKWRERGSLAGGAASDGA